MRENFLTSNIGIIERRPQASIRLFCIPYAGGSAAIYHKWSKYFSEDIEVCAVELPGRGFQISEKPIDRVLPLVEILSKNIEIFQEKSFAFFGHSIGALLSFELAKRIHKKTGCLPQHLLVAGCSAPHLPEPEPHVHTLPDAEFIETLRHLNGTPAEVLDSPELMGLFIPILRADYALHETYEFKIRPPLDCPISVFGGSHDPTLNQKRMEAWKIHTTQAFSLHIFDGDHFFIHSYESELLSLISKTLSP